MASPNFHRKLFEDPNNSTKTAEICTIQCDPLKNPSTNCLPFCNVFCPSNCTTTDPSPPPPPPPCPPPLSDDFFLTTPPTHHHSSLTLPLKISIVILVCTFSFFLLYTLYKFYTIWYRSRRRRPPPANDDNEETNDGFVDHDVVDHPIWYIRTIGLQPSVISAISVVKYSKSDGLIDGTSCSVCLSDFVEDETLRLLPKCNHAFHVPCIDTWLRSHTNCPLCRAGIVKNVNLTDSSASGLGLGSSGRVEEMRIVVSGTEEGNGEEGEMEMEEDDERIRGQIVDQSGTNENFNMRRSVSLNDYAACRIRNDVYSNNNFYSDRHEVEIQSIDGGLGFELVKVNRTASNGVTGRS